MTRLVAVSLLPLPLLLLFRGHLPSPTSFKAEFAPHFSFKIDAAPEGIMQCSADEWALVQHALDNTVPGHRKQSTRTRTRVTRLGPDDDSTKRHSYLFGDGCGSLETKPQHRHHSAASNLVPSFLTSVDQCAVNRLLVNSTLHALLPRLSPSCQALIASPLDIACAQRVPCHVSHFSLWNVEEPELQYGKRLIVAKVPTSGGTFCANTSVAFEAVATFDVGGPVQFSLEGSSLLNGLHQDNTSTRQRLDLYQSPFILLDSKQSGAAAAATTSTKGMRFAVGDYTLSATTTATTATATSETKRAVVTETQTIRFKVVPC